MERCEATAQGNYAPDAILRISVLRPGPAGHESLVIEEELGLPLFDTIEGPALIVGEPRTFFESWWEADPHRGGRSKFQNLKEAVCDVIEELPDHERKYIKMYYFQNKTPGEIGEALGLDEKETSEVHERALETLYATIGERTAGGGEVAEGEVLDESIQSTLATYHVSYADGHPGLLDMTGVEESVYLRNLPDDSPQALAGLNSYDILIEYAGERILSVEQARGLVQSTDPGESVTVRVLRMTQEEKTPTYEVVGGLLGVTLAAVPHVPENLP